MASRAGPLEHLVEYTYAYATFFLVQDGNGRKLRQLDGVEAEGRICMVKISSFPPDLTPGIYEVVLVREVTGCRSEPVRIDVHPHALGQFPHCFCFQKVRHTVL